MWLWVWWGKHPFLLMTTILMVRMNWTGISLWLQQYFLLKQWYLLVIHIYLLKPKVSDRDFSVTMDSYFNVKWKDQRLQSPTLFRWNSFFIEREWLDIPKHSCPVQVTSIGAYKSTAYNKSISQPGEILITWPQARIWSRWTSTSYQGT